MLFYLLVRYTMVDMYSNTLNIYQLVICPYWDCFLRFWKIWNLFLPNFAPTCGNCWSHILKTSPYEAICAHSYHAKVNTSGGEFSGAVRCGRALPQFPEELVELMPLAREAAGNMPSRVDQSIGAERKHGEKHRQKHLETVDQIFIDQQW